jgi:hypothetical protein
MKHVIHYFGRVLWNGALPNTSKNGRMTKNSSAGRTHQHRGVTGTHGQEATAFSQVDTLFIGWPWPETSVLPAGEPGADLGAAETQKPRFSRTNSNRCETLTNS